MRLDVPLKALKKLMSHKGFLKYSKNAFLLVLEKLFRLIVGLLTSVWVARYLGPDDFGLLNYAISFAGIFSIFSTLGLDGIVVRELLTAEARRHNKILGTALFLKLSGAVIVLIGLIIFALSSKDSQEAFLVLIISFSTVFQSANVVDFYFQSKVKAHYVVVSSIFALAISSVLKIILIVNEAELYLFAWVSVIECLVVAIGLLQFYKSTGQKINKWSFDKGVAKKLLCQSWPMIFSGFAVSFYMKIDQVMVKEILGASASGFYAVSVKFSEIWIFVTVAITKSLFPAVVNAKKISEAVYYDRLRRMYQFLVLLALCISISVTVFADELIGSTYGSQYLPAVTPLRIYVWSNIFVFLNNGSWSWYLSEGLQKQAACRLMIGAASNFLLNLYMIERFGMEGAAIATLISYSIASYFGNLFFKETRVNFKMQTLAIANVFNFRSYLK